MEKKLIFVDEKDCREVCSTIILAHCKDKTGSGEKCPHITIGKTILQKDEISKEIVLDSIKKALDFLEIMTPAELAISAGDLMADALKGEEKASEIYSIDTLIHRRKELFPDGIVFLSGGSLDLKNLSFDVDRMQVRILRYLEVSERFDVQCQLFGRKMEILNEDSESRKAKTEISAFIYAYLPHLFANMLKKQKLERIDVDILGLLRITHSYLPFRLNGRTIDESSAIKEHLKTAIGDSIPAKFGGNSDDNLKSYLGGLLEAEKSKYNRNKPLTSLEYRRTSCLFNLLTDESFSFFYGIQPIAIWE
jgi:hypothetical protein